MVIRMIRGVITVVQVTTVILSRFIKLVVIS